MSDTFNESTVEEAALSWFEELGYAIAHGPSIAPGEPGAERDSFGDVVLVKRLRDAIDRLNPDIPAEAREEAFRKVLRPDSPSLVGNNRAFHADAAGWGRGRVSQRRTARFAAIGCGWSISTSRPTTIGWSSTSSR